MFPGKEKFEFGYDLLRHSAFCIEHEILIETSKKFKSSVKYIKRELRQVPVYHILQYSAISVALVFFILKRYFYELSMGVDKRE